ncbi:fibronectin type III domain-containing protein [Cystobacter fuscus]|uniref:fibronectin type III domain-containing protein n=1 Tax=Cystobacter fuscus TaxID=43 RepID=UPI002B2ECB54|nr:fibronectin type III domain-containing protein [Cystobacter fuscus]
MSKASKALLLLASLGLGCDPKSEPQPPPVEDKSFRVRSVQYFHTASGVEERPADFSTDPMKLFVLADGNFIARPGARTSAEEYAFADVPDGTYYLKWGNSYVVTSARRVDRSSHWLGRADAQELPESTFPVRVRLDINGLEPWAEDVQSLWGNMQLVSGELDVAGSINADEVMQPQSTSVRGAVVSFNIHSNLLPFRFEQARGDRAWVNQLVPRVAGKLADGSSLRYATLARSLHLAPFSFDGSQPLSVSGTFQALPQKPLSLSWALSSFAPHAADVHPAARLDGATFSLVAAAHGVEDAGWVGFSGELLSFVLPADYATDVRDTLVYGNPFPSTWGEVAWFDAPFAVNYPIPGTESLVTVYASMEVYERVSSLAAGPIQPLILPPRGLRLDGEDTFPARPVTLGSHVISWQPPASGQVSAYRLMLRRYVVDGDSARFVDRVSFTLGGQSTSMRLPPDVLKPASHYVVQLAAISAPGYSAENTGALYHLPKGQAETLSGLLSTP